MNLLVEIESEHITGRGRDLVGNHGKLGHRRGVVVESNETTIHRGKTIELEWSVDVLGVKDLVTRTLDRRSRGVDLVHTIDTTQVVTRKSLVKGILDLLRVGNSGKGLFLLGRKRGVPPMRGRGLGEFRMRGRELSYSFQVLGGGGEFGTNESGRSEVPG